MSHILKVLAEAGREPSRREETRYGDVRVNPSKSYLKSLIKKIPEKDHATEGLRIIRDENKNHYVWNAYDATHEDIGKELGLSGKLDYSVASYKKIKDWDHNIDDAMSSNGFSRVHADYSGIKSVVFPGPNRDRKFMVQKDDDE